MNWQEVCEHPVLKNLPFKVELNERGQIVMSPVRIAHALYQGEIGYLLRTLLKQGKTLPECAVRTRKGTKVADVAWVSPKRLEAIRYEIQCSVAPEICVEVLSDSNSDEEIDEKKQLYFEAGAKEVWVCTQDGDMSFYDSEGPLEKSLWVPDFPAQIQI
jgi:Uma2 family endonuclease